MRRLSSFLTMFRIAARHGTRRAGDIAIHKADALLGRIGPALAIELAPLDPVVPTLDVAHLRALPPHTFGHRYMAFLDDNGLHPFVVTELTPAAVLERNRHWARYAVVHDMFHVLLGAGPDLAGEMKVYAFTLAQRISWVFWLYLPIAWLVLPLLAPHRIGAMVRGFSAGFTAGRRVPHLMAQRLEDRFEDDLDAVREAVGLPVPAAASPVSRARAHAPVQPR